jgi:hypothetical protein
MAGHCYISSGVAKIGLTTILALNLSATPSGSYIEYTDGTAIYRKGVRTGAFVIDKALTATGFNGIEGVDWENIYNIE